MAGGGHQPGSDSALARVRSANKHRRKLEPYRIIITSDAQSPTRTLVIPRRAPRLVLAGVLVLLFLALGFGFVSLQLHAGLQRLQARVTMMIRAAQDVAKSPWSRGRRGDLNQERVSEKSSPPSAKPELGGFELESVNTGERIRVVLDLAKGEVQPESYRQLRRLMRCMRTTAETALDPRLVETLYQLSRRTKQRIQIVSGFRAPMFSTADLSYHTRGMAADIRIPGMTPMMLRDLALSMGIKGVGYYPVSKFVHIDVREERFTWTDYGKDRDDGEGREHGPKATSVEDEDSLAQDAPPQP